MPPLAFPRRPLVRMPLRFVLIALATLVGAMATAQAAQAAYPIKLKATIERVKALDCTDEDEALGGCGSDPDFYARMYFDGAEVLDTEDRVDDDNKEIAPSDWSAEKSFDLERGKIGVDVQVRDQDGGFRGPADPVDVTQGVGRDLHFDVNLAPCALSNGLSAECTVNLTSTPSVVTSGTANDRGELTLKVEVIDTDTDGDALLDGWETRGLDNDGDTNVDVDLPAQGANPRRHDLFVEADCLVDRGGDGDLTDETDHSHCPIEGAIADVVTGFANAPGGPRTSNPDGTTGIQLHIDTGALYGAGRIVPVSGGAGATGSYGDFGGGTQIPETAANLVVDWDGATGNPATSVYAIKNANFDARRRYAYRYALFAHQTNNRKAVNDCTSGWAENAPANDFIVTLGGLADRDNDGNIEGPCWTATAGNGADDDSDGRTDEDRVNGRDDDADGSTDEDGANHSFGSRAEQAGTFMHEFGHALGLDHGGGDTLNNKPNYLSVMNYSFQSCSVPAAPPAAPAGSPALPGGCDFSRDALAALEERLGTPAGFGGLDECRGFDGGVFGFGPSNWNGNTVVPGGAAMFEGVTNCQAPNNANVSADANGDSSRDNLPGYDDWDNIFYPFYSIAEFTNGVADPIADEPDPESIDRARRFMSELLAPDLAVDKTGPAAASAGDSIAYDLALINQGAGPAFDVTLADAKPDGSHASFDIGFLKAGADAQRSVSYLVPCTAGDGDVLTDTATTNGVDLLGERERTPANNRDSLSTTVRAPVLELAASATASVRAGEAITYRLTYDNIGSGAAGEVRITAVLPADVYYSAALDTGAGPAPTSVARAADGTTTLGWTVGTVAGDSGPHVIEYTARPSLLFAGSSVAQAAKLTFTNANDCEYAPVTATGSTTIATAAPTRNPLSQGYWKNHPAERTSEFLARIQATDQRYDGDDGSAPDGRLSAAEAQDALDARGTPPRLMGSQLLATYLNLATRRIDAGTVVRSKTATRIGAANVRDVARYAMATLAALPVAAYKDRYSDAITALDEINNNTSEVY